MAAKRWRFFMNSAIFLAAINLATKILLSEQCEKGCFFGDSAIFLAAIIFSRNKIIRHIFVH